MVDFSTFAATSTLLASESSQMRHHIEGEKTKDAVDDLSRLKDVKFKLNGVINAVVRESPIPIEVIYNKEVEKLRIEEYDAKAAPMPIKFDISDSYSGIESLKMVRLET